MNRRIFLQGLVATAAGILIPGQVAAEPERRIWVLDQTMVRTREPVFAWPLPEDRLEVHWSDGYVETFPIDPKAGYTNMAIESSRRMVAGQQYTFEVRFRDDPTESDWGNWQPFPML